MRVNVDGKAHVNDNGEACILATTATPTGSGSVLPLCLTNDSLGGGWSGSQAAVWGWHFDLGPGGSHRTWGEVTGLNNIGLLVRTSGRVTEIEPVEAPHLPTWFTIDDGSGVNLKCTIPDGVTIDPTWTHVTVTGISSCEKSGPELHRLLRSITIAPV